MKHLMRDAICMDVGGTSLKSAIFTEEGALVPGSVRDDPVDSHGTAEAILNDDISCSAPARRMVEEMGAARYVFDGGKGDTHALV
jgi:hypothetical protein